MSMDTYYLTRHFGKQTLHLLHFDPTTFTCDDLLYLSLHHKLQSAVTKRKTEHLAGRIATFHAIKSLTGHDQVFGLHSEPLWPKGIRGREYRYRYRKVSKYNMMTMLPIRQ